MGQRHLIGRGRTADIFTWEDNRILKLFKTGIPQHIVDKEYKISKIIQENKIPAPKVFGITEYDGRNGIIYERVDGITMMKQINNKPWSIIKEARRLAKIHSKIHRFIAEDLPIQRKNLENDILESDLLSDRKKDIIVDFLSGLPDDKVICHGDFHPDNIFITKRGPMVIDWLTCTIGNPIADVARTSLLLRLGTAPPNTSKISIGILNLIRFQFYNQYLKQYIKESKIKIQEIKKWELPIAAARLSEDLPKKEKLKLLKIVDYYIEEYWPNSI